MATVAATPGNLPVVTSGPGRRYDHFFFSGMAGLLLATVFVGFARTYYLAGMFHATLPSAIIHLHGAAFSCWILMLVAQTSLVAAGRVDIHRRLGVFGFLLACAMVVLGVLAGTDSLARGFAPPGLDPATFYVVPITDMLIFSTLIFFAFRNRCNPAAHKRLILIATIGLMIAALVTYLFLLLLVGYDLWSIRKVHRATLWAGAFLIVVQQIRVPIAKTAAWHVFAAWAQSIRH